MNDDSKESVDEFVFVHTDGTIHTVVKSGEDQFVKANQLGKPPIVHKIE